MQAGSPDAALVLVLDTDDARRSATCALLERDGYDAVGAGSIDVLAGRLDEPRPKVLLVDVSAPRSWQSVMQEHAALRAFVADRCPIVLYGDRPRDECSELEFASRAAAHIPAHPEGRHVLALLRRLLPSPAPPRTTRAPSGERRSVVVPHATKLLLIDDSEMTLEMMQSTLSEIGFDVRIAVALGEVRSIVAHWHPNVIVADVKRPDMSGDELCARIKASVQRNDVFVLLCSSLPDAELAELARHAGADGYVSKSQGLERFVEQLVDQTRHFLGRAASRPAKEAT